MNQPGGLPHQPYSEPLLFCFFPIGADKDRALAPLAMRLHPPSLASISLSIKWGVNDHPSAKSTGVEGESERAFGVTGF